MLLLYFNEFCHVLSKVDVARQHIDYHTKKFGYKSSNVMFLNGYIEDLERCGIPVESTDIIVCVSLFN